ncbi:hypothetical protein MKW92_045489 [Papaver armeniacum]|nr:hypothetical protein MKW92_045489 [Papaver armeniacum]
MSHDRHSSSTSISFEENNMFVDVLHEAPLYGHRKPTRIVGNIVYCFLLASYGIVAIASPWIFVSIQGLVAPLLCSCNVALLLITGIFQQYLVYEVQKVRLQGYYVFSQKLKHIMRLPFATFTYGTCIMLLVMVWQPEFGILSLSALLRIIILVEVVCAASFMGLYVAYVHQYNCLNSQPDVLKSLYSALQPESPLEELRYHDGGRLSDQQMALLKSSTLVMLTGVILSHSQMNQVQSELRLARNLIAEKDLEVQKFTQLTYIKENERLRAIMGEWSARAAKLERALEAEQRSNLDLQKKISKLRNQSTTEKTEL